MTTSELFNRYKQISERILLLSLLGDMIDTEIPEFLGLMCEQYLILKELTSAAS
jgi:hypothetical protein